jgi:hypothetical protein
MSSVLSGWSAVGAIALILILLTIASCLSAMRGLISTLAVTVLTFPAMWLLACYAFGDASIYFPRGTFSEGADGKDQIVIVSILCTVLGGIIGAACCVWLIHRIDSALGRLSKPQR